MGMSIVLICFDMFYFFCFEHVQTNSFPTCSASAPATLMRRRVGFQHLHAGLAGSVAPADAKAQLFHVRAKVTGEDLQSATGSAECGPCMERDRNKKTQGC